MQELLENAFESNCETEPLAVSLDTSSIQSELEGKDLKTKVTF